MADDHDTTLEALRRAVIAFRDERDWEQFHRPKDLALALLVEAGELGELLLWRTDEELRAALAEPELRERLADELADVQAFIFYLAEAVGLDLSSAVRAKLVKNALKYPVEKARGSARKYTELARDPEPDPDPEPGPERG